MNKCILVILVLLLAAGTAAFLPFGSEAPGAYAVAVRGNAIVYEGDLSLEGLEAAKKLYTKDITNFVITSEGGEITTGIAFGEWIFDHQLDVTVEKYALSSAANYIFPAGKTKFLHRDSLLGWHGGATQQTFSPFESFLRVVVFRNYSNEAEKREDAFFKKIHADKESTVFGQRKEFESFHEDTYAGWTYSIPALAQFNIRGIVLLDGVWEPALEWHGKRIFLIDAVTK